MCLGEIARVDEVVAPGQLRVSAGGRALLVSTMASPDTVATGDWVLIHSGFVLGRISEDEARDALAARSVITRGDS